MGRWDSRYGRECCCERIQRYVERLNVIRENEVMGIENCLHGYRKQAGCAIAEYRSLSDDLEKTDIVLFGDDPDTIRANRSNKEKKNQMLLKNNEKERQLLPTADGNGCIDRHDLWDKVRDAGLKSVWGDYKKVCKSLNVRSFMIKSNL